jgi:hyperosmotically inducible periplasmic protein
MFKRMSVVICGLAVMMMTAGVATAQTATQEAKAKTKTAAKKTESAAKKAGDATEKAAKDTGANITDASITTAVKTKLLADTKVGGLKIDVDTNNHVVTLTGPVHSAAEKAEAVRLAKTTTGVHKVVSKLTIEPKK